MLPSALAHRWDFAQSHAVVPNCFRHKFGWQEPAHPYRKQSVLLMLLRDPQIILDTDNAGHE